MEYFPDKLLGHAYTVFFYIFVYMIPVLTMFATYGRIAVTLWRRRPVGDTPDTLRDSRRRLKVGGTLFFRILVLDHCVQFKLQRQYTDIVLYKFD